MNAAGAQLGRGGARSPPRRPPVPRPEVRLVAWGGPWRLWERSLSARRRPPTPTRLWMLNGWEKPDGDPR